MRFSARFYWHQIRLNLTSYLIDSGQRNPVTEAVIFSEETDDHQRSLTSRRLPSATDLEELVSGIPEATVLGMIHAKQVVLMHAGDKNAKKRQQEWVKSKVNLDHAIHELFKDHIELYEKSQALRLHFEREKTLWTHAVEHHLSSTCQNRISSEGSSISKRSYDQSADEFPYSSRDIANLRYEKEPITDVLTPYDVNCVDTELPTTTESSTSTTAIVHPLKDSSYTPLKRMKRFQCPEKAS
jgi:hypothetical protein